MKQSWFTNRFSEEVWQKKYAGNFDDVEHYYRNLAQLVAGENEELEEKFFALLWEKRFSPAGRILAGAGRNGAKVSWMNCTTHQIEEDSIDGISHAAHIVMRASSRGQGIGVDLSKLRPRGAPVNNSAVTSTGAISFMELINHAGGIIGQEGRRAALLFSINDNHPDLWRPGENDVECGNCSGGGCLKCDSRGYFPYDFLHIKRTPGKVTNANISVNISDKLIQAVKDDEDWVLEFDTESSAGRNTEKRIVKARYLLRAISASAHASAEPGVLFIDTTRKFSNSDIFGEQWSVVGVNACQPGFATVLTKKGIRTFDDIGVDTEVWDGEKWVKVVKKWTTGTKPVYEIITSRGRFVGTLDHKVFEDGERVWAAAANSIDQVVGPVGEQGDFDPQAIIDGLVIGDGSFHRAERSQKVVLYVGEKDKDYLNSPRVGSLIGDPNGVGATYTHDVTTRVVSEELPHTYERVIPERYYFGSQKVRRSFLRGLFSANGYVVSGNSNRIGLKASSAVLIKQVQELLSSLGIDSYITVSRERDNEFPNGTYRMREAYDLNITTHGDLFMTLIGFEQEYKREAYTFRGAVNTAKRGGIVQTWNYLGELPVYEITVDSDKHAYWSGGLLVSNCTEQLLDQEGVCNLGSMNLAAYVVNPFTDKAYFDVDSFALDVGTAVEFLDNVLDIELEKGNSISERQRRSIQYLRRIGLGVMGLADMLAMLGLPYNTGAETLRAVEDVFRQLRDKAYLKSVSLAQEKGMAGVFEGTTKEERKGIVEQGFFQTLPEDIKRQIIRSGVRNVTLLSVAPTGSISNLLGVSSGIEPLFALEYVRRYRLNGHDEFVDYTHPAVKQSRDAGIPDSWWTTAYQVPPFDHVKIQAVAQEFVDQSISKTTNLPSTAQVEDVMGVYMLAHELGLKGLAVYVDGSRDEQILHEKDQCPICLDRGNVVHKEGCKECTVCGWEVCMV